MNTKGITNYFRSFNPSSFTNNKTTTSSKSAGRPKISAPVSAPVSAETTEKMMPLAERKSLELNEKQAFLAEQNTSRLQGTGTGETLLPPLVFSRLSIPHFPFDELHPEEKRNVKNTGHRDVRSEPGQAAEKALRRRGFIAAGEGITSTEMSRLRRPDNQVTGNHKKKLEMFRLMADSMLSGTKKLRNMEEAELDHIFKMIEANDVGGLQSVLDMDKDNLFRRFTTGLKVGEQALSSFPQVVPQELQPSLNVLKGVYEQNKLLRSLGNPTDDGLFKPRSAQEVQQLREEYKQADQALADVEQALAWWQEHDPIALSLPEAQ